MISSRCFQTVFGRKQAGVLPGERRCSGLLTAGRKNPLGGLVWEEGPFPYLPSLTALSSPFCIKFATTLSCFSFEIVHKEDKEGTDC